MYASSDSYAAFIENPHASGDGLRIRAGDVDTDRPLLVEDKGAANLFAVYGGGGVDIPVGVVTARNTTQSSTAANGAFQIKGGASVAKNLFVGGGAHVGAAFTINSGIGVTIILDEDDMASNSATALASQQSIKTYVDTQITAEDLDFAGDSGTGAVDLDSQSLTISGTASEIKTVASGQSLTISLPDDVIVGNALTVTGIGTFYNDVKFAGSDGKQALLWDKSENSLAFGDSKIAAFGNGHDLKIFSNSGHSYLRHDGGGNIYIQNSASQEAIRSVSDGAVFVGYAGNFKLQTTETGAITTGIHTADGFSVGDFEYITAGIGSDLALYHDTSNSWIKNTTNTLILASDLLELKNEAGTKSYLKGTTDAATEIYWNNSKKFETGPAGVIVTGIATADGFALGDNEKITFGASEDFKIEHNSDENYIDSNSGHIYIRANVNDDEGDNIYLQPKSGENGIIVTHDGSVELYHDAQKTFETFANGIVVRSGGEGNDGEIQLYADQGDDNADLWRLKADTSGIFGVDSYGTGSWVNKLQVNPSGAIVSGILTAVGGFNIGIQSGHTLINTGVGNSIGIVTAINFVGSGNTVVYNSSTKTVDIAISGGGGGAGGISTTYQNISSTSATGIATFSATAFRAASIVLSVTQGTSYQAGRYMVIHDGTTPTVVEESAVATGSMIASFDATIGSGNLTFRATMGSSGIATVGIKVDTLRSDSIP